MPVPKFKIGDAVIVLATWGDTPQTEQQYLMGRIDYAWVNSGEWVYHMEVPFCNNGMQFLESEITTKVENS